MTVPLRILPTPDALGLALATHVGEALTAAAADRHDLLVGWPAGRTPQVLVDGLCILAGQGLDLSHLVLVGMDEFVTKNDGRWQHVDNRLHYSCRGWNARKVVKPLTDAALPGRGLRKDSVWTPPASNPETYERRITDAGGVDIFVVASGSGDGHVALNSPPANPASRTRVVELPESTRRDNLATFPELRSLAEAPTHGVTVGIATIADAAEVILLLPGSGKQLAARQLLALDAFDPAWPASFVHDHPRATCWTDEQALDQTAAAVPVSAPTSATRL